MERLNRNQISFEQENQLEDLKELQEKYNNENKRFSIIKTLTKFNEENSFLVINCLYKSNEDQFVELEFEFSTKTWKINSNEINENLQLVLSSLFDDLYQIRCLTIDEQIELIIERLNQYFQEQNEKFKLNNDDQRNLLKSHCSDDDFVDERKDLVIPEDDQISKDIPDFNLQSLLNVSRSKYSSLIPPPVAPRRSRQNSACSTQSSVRYASFFPPPTAPLRRKRVIQSILLHVHKKKKPFEKLFEIFNGNQPITMYQLGMEFLRFYDGKFNYHEGHTFVMSFGKKIWYLTIDKIKCVECQIGEQEPRSVLILEYKGHLTRVHL